MEQRRRERRGAHIRERSHALQQRHSSTIPDGDAVVVVGLTAHCSLADSSPWSQKGTRSLVQEGTRTTPNRSQSGFMPGGQASVTLLYAHRNDVYDAMYVCCQVYARPDIVTHIGK